MLTSRETDEEKTLRLSGAQTRKIRKLCGWNVFQKVEFGDKNLSAEDYRANIKHLSARWKAMSPEEKEPFNVEAELQQNRIDALSETRLPTKRDHLAGVAEGEETDGVWRNARRKISCKRLSLNMDSFQTHGLWDLPTQYGDGHFGQVQEVFVSTFIGFCYY